MTTIISRVLVALVLLLAAVGLGEYAFLQSTRAQLARAEEAINTAQAENDTLRSTIRSTNAALKVRSKALAEARTKVAAARKDLDHAIQTNPGWSATPVPDAVWDSLYGPAPKAVPAR